MSDALTLTWLLRLVGASHLALALAHVVIWRAFDWSGEIARLSPLTGRVFVAHMSVVVFVLIALGLLGVGRPDLLERQSELARFLLGAIVVFWSARLAAQSFVFDSVLLRGSKWRLRVRVAAMALFGSYVAVYTLAFAHQLH